LAIATNDDIIVSPEVLVECIFSVLVVSIDELVAVVPPGVELGALVPSRTDVVLVGTSVDAGVAPDSFSSDEVIFASSTTDEDITWDLTAGKDPVVALISIESLFCAFGGASS